MLPIYLPAMQWLNPTGALATSHAPSPLNINSSALLRHLAGFNNPYHGDRKTPEHAEYPESTNETLHVHIALEVRHVVPSYTVACAGGC